MSFSCRVLFDLFLMARMKQNPEKKKVLATCFMHTSFPKSIEFLGLEMDVIDIGTIFFTYSSNAHHIFTVISNLSM